LFDEPLFKREGHFGVREFENPRERGFGLWFVDPAFCVSNLPFVDTREVGVEKGVEGSENPVDGFQGGEGLVACDAAVADRFTDHIAVFLLDIGIIVLVVLAAPGKGDTVGFTPVFEGPVAKFGPVIAVQAPVRDGKPSKMS
jgi:hypothetical protein